jgi:hypothetical protein
MPTVVSCGFVLTTESAFDDGSSAALTISNALPRPS